ncbi:Os01g0280600, partial [Oryza sativa Japonica Group]
PRGALNKARAKQQTRSSSAPPPIKVASRASRALPSPTLPSEAGVTGPRYQARRPSRGWRRIYRPRIPREMARWD